VFKEIRERESVCEKERKKETDREREQKNKNRCLTGMGEISK
jgi:hypothetical protein